MSLSITNTKIFKHDNGYQIGILKYTLENEYISSVIMDGKDESELPDKIIFYCCPISYKYLVNYIKKSPVKKIYMEIRSLNNVIIHRYNVDRTSNNVGNIKISEYIPSVFSQIRFDDFTHELHTNVYFLISNLSGYSEIHPSNKNKLFNSEISQMDKHKLNMFSKVNLIISSDIIDDSSIFESYTFCENSNLKTQIQKLVEDNFGSIISSEFIPLETTINFNETSDIIHAVCNGNSSVIARTRGRIGIKGHHDNESGNIVFIGKNINFIYNISTKEPIAGIIISDKYNVSYLRYLLELVDICSVFPSDKNNYNTWLEQHKKYVFNYITGKSFTLDDHNDNITLCFNNIFEYYNNQLSQFISSMKHPSTPQLNNNFNNKLFSAHPKYLRQSSVMDI